MEVCDGKPRDGYGPKRSEAATTWQVQLLVSIANAGGHATEAVQPVMEIANRTTNSDVSSMYITSNDE